MHDAKGRELKVGDRVIVPFTVTSVNASREYCNVGIESVATMPGNDSKCQIGAINTRQMLRANPGDDTSFEVSQVGAATELS